MMHNDRMVVHRYRDGGYEVQAYILKHRSWGWRWEYFTTDHGDYLTGYQRPHYPVPAIRYEVEWTPEYGGNVRIYDKPGHFWIWYDDLIDYNSPSMLRDVADTW